MASKTHFLIVLAIAIMATSVADAQLIRLNLTVTGNVPCALSSSPGAPVFANATVQLQCLTNNAIASALANANGSFIITLNAPLIQTANIIPLLLTNRCNVVVATSLATCNASLPAIATSLATCNASLPATGRLVSNSLNVSISTSLLNLVINIVASVTGFTYNAGATATIAN